MSKQIVFHLSKGYDLVNDLSADEKAVERFNLNANERRQAAKDSNVLHSDGKVYESTGVFPVAAMATGETEMRHRIESVDVGNAVTSYEDGWAPDPTELAAFLRSVTERNVPVHALTGVSGDDPRLVRRIAALLDTEVIEEQT